MSEATWRVLRWDNQPEIEGSIPFTCVDCGRLAEVPCGTLVGGALIGMTPDNWMVFDPPCYEPPENFLPSEIQCRKCGCKLISKGLETELIEEEA